MKAAALCLSCFALAPAAGAAELTLPRDGWSSWEVAAVDAAPDWCCWSDWNSKRGTNSVSAKPCKLDGNRENYGNRDDETTDAIRMYAHTAAGKVDRLRVFSASCPVEAATPITDLGHVSEDTSARWLMGRVKQDGERALTALAMHRGDIARDGLASIARTDTRAETRKEAVFWLAQVRGVEGAEITSSVMFNDKDPDVREHAAFALSQSKLPRAAADLIRLGTTDESGKVRSQAWFWLAQMGAPEAESAIVASLRKEPDDDVREDAIFALSQLPDERAPRALIAAIEDKSLSREERKRALFWLGQSESAAATAYIDRVLTAN
jgi:hypothetical protein